MKRIQARVKDRDTNLAWEDSDIELLMNPSGDRKKYIQWCINSNGAMDDLSSEQGIKWNSHAQVVVKRGKKEWHGTLTIPKSDLGSYDKNGFPVAFTRCRALEAPGAMPKERFYCFLPNPAETRNSRDPEYWGRLDLSGKPAGNLVLNGNFKGLGKMPDKRFYYVTKRGTPENQSITLDRRIFVTQGQSVCIETKEPKRIDLQFKTQGMKPGKRYCISFFLRTENLKGWGLSSSLYCGKDKSVKLNERPVTGTNPWHRLSFDITAPEHFVNPDPVVVIGCNATTGKFWIDEVRVDEIR